MRESKREAALEAAKRIVQREGVTALSYEAVAAEAALTKGGLLYHFPSREDLLLALHQYVADQWEQCMVREVGQDTVTGLDEDTRTAAYVRASQNPDRAELLLTLEAATQNTAANQVWNGVYQRWAAQEPTAAEDDEAVRRFIARLAADGLWFYESIADSELRPEVRARLVEEIIALGQEPIP
ncbi:TetR/AcrR family transcriptional regulator [Nesterenkonia natronophila]|uniref:TetR/AcrR family transcriptional regulator n=1 Tax=Nesterenkonia natronophila TaxID=2174932 RepID=A0A3A4F3B3_9MICC|nr:TetR/AcrR family transcriptional regulator [Nesterenkonia natronophila]RJN32553.1 TetR/AcrR family transcriptional regulator [Nesterenkonia natronophila]